MVAVAPRIGERDGVAGARRQRAAAGEAVVVGGDVVVHTRFAVVPHDGVARGEGRDPWTALARAVKALTPGLP